MTTRKVLAITIALVMICSLCMFTTIEEKDELVKEKIRKHLKNSIIIVALIEKEHISSKGLHQYVVYDPQTDVLWSYIAIRNDEYLNVVNNEDGSYRFYLTKK